MGGFVRSTISSVYFASVIVFAGYLLCLSFVSLKPFSLILSIDVLRMKSRQMIKRYGVNSLLIVHLLQCQSSLRTDFYFGVSI